MRILYYDIDTLRADHLRCYGYLRDTSPNIDRLAGEGVRFEHCYVSDAPCLPSRASMFTGRFGIHTGVVNHGGLAADIRPPPRRPRPPVPHRRSAPRIHRVPPQSGRVSGLVQPVRRAPLGLVVLRRLA